MSKGSGRGGSSHHHGSRSHASGRSSRRNRGGIGPDGKPIKPIAITVVTVLLLLAAVYFGTVEGWFKAKDPASVEATLPPEVTPQPTYSGSRPISALDEKSLTVFAVDVGSGSCSLLVSPNGRTMLIDSGDESHYPAVKELLDGHGIQKLDIVFATSPEEAYSGAMANVIADYSVGRFYACSGLLDSEHSAIADALEEKGVTASNAEAGSVSWDKSCAVSVLAPQGAEEGALLIRVEHSGSSFLFAGSVKAQEEDAALAALHSAGLASTVLFVGRCGSEEATGARFVTAVSPSYAVISTGSAPANQTLAALNAAGAKIYRTDRHGTVKLVVDKNGLKVS